MLCQTLWTSDLGFLKTDPARLIFWHIMASFYSSVHFLGSLKGVLFAGSRSWVLHGLVLYFEDVLRRALEEDKAALLLPLIFRSRSGRWYNTFMCPT